VPTIVDCSPVDLIAWMLCDVGSQDSPALAKRVMGYVDSALGLAKRYYNGVIVTRPLGPDRSPANPVNSAFQFHVQCVVESAAGRLRGPLLTRVLRGASLQERADEATEIIDQEEHDFRAELERERLALH
jgi:hypothetical protein